jgi:hypothetical protein
MGGASCTIAACQQRVVHLDTQVPDDALDFGVSREELDSGQVDTGAKEDQDRRPSPVVSARWPAGMFSQEAETLQARDRNRLPRSANRGRTGKFIKFDGDQWYWLLRVPILH